MTDIKQLIEEEATSRLQKIRKDALKSFCANKKKLETGNSEDYVTAYIIGHQSREKEVYNLQYELSEIEHQNRKYEEATRWRKVEEELPQEDKCRISLPVLIKTKYGLYDVAYYSYVYNDFVIGQTAIFGVVEWRPIE